MSNRTFTGALTYFGSHSQESGQWRMVGLELGDSKIGPVYISDRNLAELKASLGRKLEIELKPPSLFAAIFGICISFGLALLMPKFWEIISTSTVTSLTVIDEPQQATPTVPVASQPPPLDAGSETNSNSMFCGNCGTKGASNNDKFCRTCGSALAA